MATNAHLMNTYGRIDVSFEHGENAWLFDNNGNKYFDTFFGIAVCGLGHSHPRVTEAVKQQAGRLIHCSNLYHSPIQDELATALCAASDMQRVFFSNSGAEANEAAIKLARLHGSAKGVQNPHIIVMENAFHGRTMATLTATGNRKAQAGFEPLLSGFVRAPFNDIEAIEAIARSNPNVVAVMLEPVQGEGGVYPADPAYIQAVESICRDNDWLFIADEVQSGNGRCGRYFATQSYGVSPDVITTAKGLGNGYPIGACLARGKAAELFAPGHHGSTFGGNPLGCAAALATVSEIQEKNLPQRAEILGTRLVESLKQQLMPNDYIKDIRGKGLMIGIELSESCTELPHIAQSKGVLINVTSQNVVRLLPPLNMSDEELDFLVDAVVQLIKLYAADDRAQPRQAES